MVRESDDRWAFSLMVGPLSQSPTVIWAPAKVCDDTDLVTNLVTKQNADHWVGVGLSVSCCFCSGILVAGARFELATFGL